MRLPLIVFGVVPTLVFALRFDSHFKLPETSPSAISYAIPDAIWDVYRPLREHNAKTRMFAQFIPGTSWNRNYAYDNEEDYYEQYSTAMFGITQEKAGWDCLRHYEIIAAGAIPYFMNIENMPNNTMTTFPKTLVRRAMQLRGVPSEGDVTKMISAGKLWELDMNEFDQVGYNKIRNELLQYAEQHLLTRHMAASVVPTRGNRIYMHTAQNCPQGYLRALMAMGLMANGNQVFLDPPVPEMFDDCDKSKAAALYGRGFSYTCRTPHSNHIKEPLSSDVKWDYYILNAECNRPFPKPLQDLLQNAMHMIAVDGADEGGHHPVPSGVEKIYSREHDHTRKRHRKRNHFR